MKKGEGKKEKSDGIVNQTKVGCHGRPENPESGAWSLPAGS